MDLDFSGERRMSLLSFNETGTWQTLRGQTRARILWAALRGPSTGLIKPWANTDLASHSSRLHLCDARRTLASLRCLPGKARGCPRSVSRQHLRTGRSSQPLWWGGAWLPRPRGGRCWGEASPEPLPTFCTFSLPRFSQVAALTPPPPPFKKPWALSKSKKIGMELSTFP